MENGSLPPQPLTANNDQDGLVLHSDYDSQTLKYTASRPHSTYIASRPTEGHKPTRDNCDRRRPEEEDSSRLNMSQKMVGQAVSPFFREHIPGVYAPISKAHLPAITKSKDPNSKFCYRHRPDSKCRRAADESKMSLIQSELERLPQADQQAISHVWSLFSAAPIKHRELMLQGVITQCCFPQLSLVSREVSEQLKIDFVSALPTELSFKILSFLDCASLCKAAQVSRRWHALADDNVVWHHLCQQHIDRKCKSCGWALPKMEAAALRNWRKEHQLAMRSKTSQAAHVRHLINSGSTSGESSLGKRDASTFEDNDRAKKPRMRECSEEPSVVQEDNGRKYRPWKDVYRDRFKVGSNWKYGRCSIQTFSGEHTNGVTCLQFDDNILATGSYDSTVKIWDIEKGKVIRTLYGHTSGIRALKFDSTKLVSGGLDGTVRIFCWRTGKLLNTLHHQGGVISVDFDGDWLASGSSDMTIRIFNFKTKESFCLRGHTEFVNQVRLDVISKTVLSASDDTTVKLWDLDTRQCLKTYSGHIGQVQQVLPLPDDFEFEDEHAHEADDVSVTSNRSGTPGAACSSSFTAPAQSTHMDDERAAYGPLFEDYPERQLPPRYMLTASLDATLRLWDTASGECKKTMFGHLEGIWGLTGDSLRYVTGAQDATVKVWDKSGRCERTFTGHTGPVTSVCLSDSRMASAGDDGDVRLYKFDVESSEVEEVGTPS